jgi:hypothetical protein
MQWASTIKEVELSHFFKEWPAMWKRFWTVWILSWVIIVGVAIMASNIVPAGYRMWVSPCRREFGRELTEQNKFHLYPAMYGDCVLSLPVSHCPQPLV